jgi:hypothetical protein
MCKYAERIILSRIRSPRLLWSDITSKISHVRACTDHLLCLSVLHIFHIKDKFI